MVHTSTTQTQHTTVRKGLAQVQAEIEPSDPEVLPICHQSHTTECPDDLMSSSNKGMATTIGGVNTIIGKS